MTLVERKSFLLYTEYFRQIKKLNIEQRGILLTAIMNFQSGEELPEMDPLTDMCFGFISDDMQRNNEKYEETVEKRREAGRKGGLATQANKANQANANFATFASNLLDEQKFKQNQANQANQADKDNVNVKVKENENESEYVGGNEYVPASQLDEPTTDNTTLTPISETEPTEYGRIPLTTEIALAFAKANYKPGPGEMERFVKYNRERKWKMPLEESVPRWIANEKKKEKKRVNFDQHEYDFNEIDMALLQKQMDLPPMEGRNDA